ncbi:dihydroxyacetone kinase subunit DhaL [Streptococcus agalactiae]|uniref:phosphoenolpyruvate--glycerone phosphotransferase n=2 Tax=Streptococcus agalactiae TaxID=1311 RepID=A0A0H1V9Y9_STRAG|nr:dihydroxyacetone kinase subunit DhaL [Streptococcus agalactiae]EJZ03469.1 dihydroxyacetone kinase family protein [Streptococcus agalactiae STIR-CD-17]EPU02399.1 dihydroxyacetone kinase [Streptococcus agalactiae STIR-CD-09]EPU04504.1 dihydroxyacetone kinase [Streptococcus agalactiae STIR-CD-13]EPW82274.1 dihydroxyacetone kinase [Streptococcus agalactiae STIR-CD-07]EPX14997.1 dihydroxyacetone kinase [Streptococcus agalactiae LDS 610]CCQ77094.1 dihydroxyacetone kinase [Streptococcus agalactia
MEVKTAIEWMHTFNQKIQSNKDYLSELDTPIGDGDHGGNMARGMTAVIENLDNNEFSSAADVFKTVSMQLLSKVGGASGPLYGSAFMGITKAEQSESTISEALGAGLEMIQKRGKAELNEKTMVDVWHGVIEAIEKNELTEDRIDSLVDATKEMKATKGRASYVGERSVGHIDPGSFSSGLLFKALLEVGGV